MHLFSTAAVKNEQPLRWFDSHCHFDFTEFDPDRETVWQSAKRAGVECLIIPGVTRAQSQQLPAFCDQNAWFSTAGFHPCFMNTHQLPDDLAWLECWIASEKVIAVGEIGLDFRPMFDNQTAQYELFEVQLVLANSQHKPVILHSVRANDQIAAVIRRTRFNQGGIVHAFSGSEQQAKVFLDLGFKLGLGGNFTHQRANRMRSLIRVLPASSWLLETDSPDMAPAFSAGQRNTPEYIPLLAASVARLQGLSIQDACAQQWRSLAEVFPSIFV